MLVSVGAKILYIAWISSGLTPSQKDPIPSLGLVKHANGLQLRSVSDACRRICFLFEEFGIVVTP